VLKDDLLSATSDTVNDILNVFYKRCLNWILEDLDSQKERLSAMREARSIIDTKLKYAAVLEGQTGGNIFIGPAPQEKPSPDEGQESSNRVLHITGKQNG